MSSVMLRGDDYREESSRGKGLSDVAQSQEVWVTPLNS
jgi:hypothetical protein